MITVWSSWVFASLCLHSLIAGEYVNFIMYYFLLPLSIFNHATLDRKFKGKYMMIYIDKFFALITVCNSLYRSYTISYEHANILPILICKSCVFWIYYVYVWKKYSWLPGNAWKPWHASVHIIPFLGSHIIMLMHSYFHW